MARYEKHPRIKGKYQCTVCDYGHKEGRSRQSVSKHFKQAHENSEAQTPKSDIEPLEIDEDVEFTSLQSNEEKVEEPQIDIKEPEWLSVEFDDGEKSLIQSIPSPVKGLINSLSKHHDPDKPKTKAEAKAWFKQQARMVRFFLAGVADPLVSWWGRGVMANPDFKIQRSESEWKMTEEVTAQWLEYRGIHVPVNPDVLMVGTIGALYLPPIAHVHRNRDPTRPKRSIRGLFQRWRQRRAIKRALKENPLLDPESVLE
jgi:hypothetical protein